MVQCNKKGNIFPMLEKSEQVRPVCCHISVLPSSRSFTRNRESIAIEVITYEFPILLFFTEGLIISLSVFLAIAIRYFFYGKSLFLYDHLILKIIFFTIVCQGTILYNDLYFKNLKDRNRLLFIKLFQSLGATSVIFPI